MNLVRKKEVSFPFLPRLINYLMDMHLGIDLLMQIELRFQSKISKNNWYKQMFLLVRTRKWDPSS